MACIVKRSARSKAVFSPIRIVSKKYEDVPIHLSGNGSTDACKALPDPLFPESLPPGLHLS